MRRDLAFEAEGATLRGWLCLPDATGPHPVVAMAHGYSALEEQYLDRYAEVFAAAGPAALAFDNRCFGASGGEPRGEIDPVRQVRDYRHAITCARTLPELDRARAGAWGTSHSGGHVLVLGATDRRVRCVVPQVPTISGPVSSSLRTRPDLVPALPARFEADRDARFAGRPRATIPVVAEDPAAPCALPGGHGWAFFERTRPFAPPWRNEATLRSAEVARECEPGTCVARIGPTPPLMLVATEDAPTPTDLALDAYNRALEPKRLVLLTGGHFDPYTGGGFGRSSAAARDRFVRHLR